MSGAEGRSWKPKMWPRAGSHFWLDKWLDPRIRFTSLVMSSCVIRMSVEHVATEDYLWTCQYFISPTWLKDFKSIHLFLHELFLLNHLRNNDINHWSIAESISLEEDLKRVWLLRSETPKAYPYIVGYLGSHLDLLHPSYSLLHGLVWDIYQNVKLV